MAIQPDPVERRTVVEERSSSGGRTLLIVALVAVVLLGIAWAAGLFSVNTDGELKAPEVEVQGGSVPDVDVQAADVDVGTKTETIEVPTIDVKRPGEGEADASK